MNCIPFWHPLPEATCRCPALGLIHKPGAYCWELEYELEIEDFWGEEWGLEWGILRRNPYYDGEGGSD